MVDCDIETVAVGCEKAVKAGERHRDQSEAQGRRYPKKWFMNTGS
jgi:hypothetical protein